MGHGPIATFTIRQMDDEVEGEGEEVKAKAKKTQIHFENSENFKVKSCRGILGRMMVGLRRKLLENIYCEGATAYAGSIANGPFSLAVLTILLVNNFSMSTLEQLEHWKYLLAAEVSDVAVSKHIAHAKELLEVRHFICKYMSCAYYLCEM